MLERNRTNRVIFHHSQSRDVPIEDVKEWHLARGFEDIGYHFYIRTTGAIETGRGLGLVGAHAKGKNYDSIGVCIAGDFLKYEPTKEQYSSAKALYFSECKKRGKQLEIEFHRGLHEDNPCPGKKLNRQTLVADCLSAWQAATHKEGESMGKYKIGKGLQKAVRTGAMAVAAIEGAKAVKAGQMPTSVEDAGKMALEFIIVTAFEFIRNWCKVKWGLFGKK